VGELQTVTGELDEQPQDPVDALAEEYLERRRRGERPTAEEYVRRRPDLADRIRDVFRVLSVLEELGTFRLAALTHDDQARPPAAAHLSPQEFGDFHVLREIGRGGMGVVYEAEQRSLGRRVALKVLPEPVATVEEAKRLHREARVAAQFEHPHIVPVYETGEHEGRPFFSMKLIEGGSLADRLARGPLPGREAAQLLVPVCRAMAAAHRGGLVHRDLKPSNILLDGDCRALITDFGLARFYTSHTITHAESVVGTPTYMSPEQAAARHADVRPASDIYSLGAILYHALTGRPPFQADTVITTLMMVLEDDPLPPRLLNPHIDPDLESVALKCLQKPAAARYTTADDLADDLEAFLDNRPVAAQAYRLSHAMLRLLRQETRFTPLLEHAGRDWMAHGWFLLLWYLVMNGMQILGVTAHGLYFATLLGAGCWGLTAGRLYKRQAPPTLMERQMNLMGWNAGIVWTGAFLLEWIQGLPVLSLAPLLGVINFGMYVMLANITSGAFYRWAAAHLACAGVMVVLQRSSIPDVGLTLLGLVSWASFFFPGRAYERQRLKQIARGARGGAPDGEMATTSPTNAAMPGNRT
jgi:eukaryotic-like serine/threonine-protein kinase